jgi:hypothetical protein
MFAVKFSLLVGGALGAVVVTNPQDLRVQAGFEVDDDLVEGEGEGGYRRRRGCKECPKPKECEECEECEECTALDQIGVGTEEEFLSAFGPGSWPGFLNLPGDFLGYPRDKCQDFSGKGGAFTTTWTVPLDLLITYPCSAGYATNFAANPGYLKELIPDISKTARQQTQGRACGNKCDINNAGYGTPNGLDYDWIYGKKFNSYYKILKLFKPKEFAFFCGDDVPVNGKYTTGALNEYWAKKSVGTLGEYPKVNACKCEKGHDGTNYEIGCIQCRADTTWSVGKCYDPVGPPLMP